MQKHLLGYRDNLRVEVGPGIPIVARTVAEIRTLSTWPGPSVLDVHIDLDPRLSVMTVRERHDLPMRHALVLFLGWILIITGIFQGRPKRSELLASIGVGRPVNNCRGTVR
jgi:hypothetical protein